MEGNSVRRADVEDDLVIVWDHEFTEPPSAEVPQFAAFCINHAEKLIDDGEDVHDVIFEAIGSVAAFACGIPEEDLDAWVCMLAYGTFKLADD